MFLSIIVVASFKFQPHHRVYIFIAVDRIIRTTTIIVVACRIFTRTRTTFRFNSFQNCQFHSITSGTTFYRIIYLQCSTQSPFHMALFGSDLAPGSPLPSSQKRWDHINHMLNFVKFSLIIEELKYS